MGLFSGSQATAYPSIEALLLELKLEMLPEDRSTELGGLGTLLSSRI